VTTVRVKYLFDNARTTLTRRKIDVEEDTVFHGSSPLNLDSILGDGFRIGGMDGHAVANGRFHGSGVYTGATASVAAAYANPVATAGGRVVELLIVKVLRGTRSPRPLSDRDCSIDDRAVNSGRVSVLLPTV